MQIIAFNRSTLINSNTFSYIIVGESVTPFRITNEYFSEESEFTARLYALLPQLFFSIPIYKPTYAQMANLSRIFNFEDKNINTELATVQSAIYSNLSFPGIDDVNIYHPTNVYTNWRYITNTTNPPTYVHINGSDITQTENNRYNESILIEFYILPESCISPYGLFDFSNINTSTSYQYVTINVQYNTNYSEMWRINEIRVQVLTMNTYVVNALRTLNNLPITEILPDGTTNDPYIDIIPESTTGGGNGSGDFEDESIDEPQAPSISAINSGFISAYSPSVGQLNALASYMWTSDFITNLNKVFGDNPMGTILGLSAIPVAPNTGSPQNVILGNVDTEIEMPVITSQYVKFNCGSINIQPKYGAFLDYEPYTSIDLFLPYIGLVQLSTNDVMGKSLAVTYTIDVLSGACVANVACGGTIMYTFEGACATQFPVTNNDYSNMFKAAIDAASSIVGAIGGAVASGLTGNVAGAVGAIADGMAGAAQAAMNAHPVVNRSGSLSGSAGLMGIQKPFIVWTTPNMVASNNQNSFIGYPNFITTSLSSLSGYTEVENINLGIAGATNEEVNEIKTLLRNGVIF